jgi:putative endonuclease
MIRHFVYILECSDATLYTGYTTEPERRVKEHNEGRGAKYTRGRRPVKLVYLEGFSDKSEAVKREKEIKKLPREKKLSLIQKIN